MNDRVLVRIKFTITTKRNSTKFQFNSIQHIFFDTYKYKSLISFSPHCSTFSGDSLETVFDGCYRAPGSTGFAL